MNYNVLTIFIRIEAIFVTICYIGYFSYFSNEISFLPVAIKEDENCPGDPRDFIRFLAMYRVSFTWCYCTGGLGCCQYLLPVWQYSESAHWDILEIYSTANGVALWSSGFSNLFSLQIDINAYIIWCIILNRNSWRKPYTQLRTNWGLNRLSDNNAVLCMAIQNISQ